MAGDFVVASLRGDGTRLSGIPESTLKAIGRSAVVIAHEVLLHADAMVAADNPKDIGSAH
jgi:hypothetical protein